MRGLFVTGTDTGVGKTLVTSALIRAAVRRGLVVAAQKPCETGAGDDGARLIAATGRALDPALARPYRFELPTSPEVAAAAAGVSIDLRPIVSAARALASSADLLFVEGAGGLLAPVAPATTMAELAQALALPLLLVARPGLGTVNHTLLTAEAARRRGLTVAGFLFSRTAPPAGPDEATNAEAISTHGALAYFGTLPVAHDDADALRLAERYLDLDRLFATPLNTNPEVGET